MELLDFLSLGSMMTGVQCKETHLSRYGSAACNVLLASKLWRRPALYGSAALTEYTDARLIATQIPRYGCMDDLTTESIFDLQATLVIYVFALFLWHVDPGWLYN